MKINSKKNPPRKRLLKAKLFSTVVLALLCALTFYFVRHPDAKSVTIPQLSASLVFVLVYIDYMVYKLRYDIFGDIGGVNW